MDFERNDGERSENIRASSSRINEKISSLECMKKELDEDMIEFERRMSEVVEHFTGFEERRKARKLMLLSFAVGISSLACRINAKVIGLPKGLLSFTTAIGLGSLAVSLYFLKGAWYYSKDVSKKFNWEIKNDSDDSGTLNEALEDCLKIYM